MAAEAKGRTSIREGCGAALSSRAAIGGGAKGCAGKAGSGFAALSVLSGAASLRAAGAAAGGADHAGVSTPSAFFATGALA
jgi:hypothetical protein